MKNNNILFKVSIYLFITSSQAQYLWYENKTKTENIQFLENSDGIFSINELNPSRSGLNSNKRVSKFIRNSNTDKGLSTFKLYKPIKSPEAISISLKAYINTSTFNLSNVNRLRLYLRNTTTGETIQKTLFFTAGKEWQDFTFDIKSIDFSIEGLRNSGYDQVQLGYGNGQFSNRSTTYYIDQISATKQQQKQYLWYENDVESENILFTNQESGQFTTDEINPNTNKNNVNITCAKFIRDSSVSKSFAYFNLFQPIETAVTFTVNLKALISVRQDKLINRPSHLRIYLKNTTTGATIFKQMKFSKGKKWEDFSFVFNQSEFTVKGLKRGGYNQMYIGFGNNVFSPLTITYYIDQIYGTTKQMPIHPLAKSMQGSWGTRFYVRGGEDLDFYTADRSLGGRNYDYIAGAKEIINSYPSTGHIITNATNNANSHLWTLRNNKNVDAVMGVNNAIVSEEFVPNLQNEQIIIDVINLFKNADKKIILYLNSLSPSERSTPTGAAVWKNYVNTYFSGNEHKAWMNYCEGYVKRFAQLEIDGYWIDAFSSYPGDDFEKDEFIQMIRDADPGIMIAANLDKDFFRHDNGESILVDSDGIEDNDDRDYRIIKLSGKDPWSDITAGHITPLDNGAPPNSWAYEEFTVTDIQENHITTYNGGSKQIVKHLFLPIRETWSGDRKNLIFNDRQQTYRFVKKITDAGGIVTFSTTTDEDGTTMEDEEFVLKYVDQKFTTNSNPTQYTRPLGAFLVEEEEIYPWYENEKNTSIDYISIVKNLHTVTTENFPNPLKKGINSTNTVFRSKRDGGTLARVYFNLPNIITNVSKLKVTLKSFVNKANPTEIESTIRVYLINTNTNKNIFRQQKLITGNTWENLEFDFSNETASIENYNQIAIGFANGDSSSATTKYYFDDIKGSINQYVATPDTDIVPKQINNINIHDKVILEEIFDEQNTQIRIYPNPVTSSFELSRKLNSIQIYNITGKKLLEFPDNSSLFNISDLNSGFYFLRGNNLDGKQEIIRFVKK